MAVFIDQVEHDYEAGRSAEAQGEKDDQFWLHGLGPVDFATELLPPLVCQRLQFLGDKDGKAKDHSFPASDAPFLNGEELQSF
jgi:hypothetical protein